MTQARWPADDRDKLVNFVNQRFVLLEGNAAIGKRWGELAGEARRVGRTIPVNDCWIAATCLVWNLPLVTLNQKHFASVSGLTVLP